MIKNLIALMLVLLATGCVLPNENMISDKDYSEISNARELTLNIEGMTCASCAYGVESQINALDGILDCSVSWKDGTGIIRYDADKVSPDQITSASTVYSAYVIDDKAI